MIRASPPRLLTADPISSGSVRRLYAFLYAPLVDDADVRAVFRLQGIAERFDVGWNYQIAQFIECDLQPCDVGLGVSLRDVFADLFAATRRDA